jgi:tetratricopeptide (TPR) repeat protein
LALIVFTVYANSLESPFLFDDVDNIAENRHIKINEISYDSLFQAAVKSPISSRWLPNISFALNYYFGGMAVKNYHIINILVHVLCGIVLYCLVLTTLKLPLFQTEIEHPRGVAFFSTLIWLLHPLQTNGVTYIVQRMTSMASLFILLSMLCYVRGRLQEKSVSRVLYFSLCAVSGFMAFASKENSVMLPVMIIGYEVFFLKYQGDREVKRNILLLSLVGLLVSITVVLLFYYKGNNPFSSILSGYALRDFTLIERLLTEPRVIFHYISLLFLPIPGRLNLNYDFIVSENLFEPISTIICILGIVVLAVYSFKKFKRNRLVSFAIFWFLGNLVIESSIVPLEIIYEHRMYLPSIFVIVAIVTLFYQVFQKKDFRLWAVLTIITAVVAILTWQRNLTWKSEVSMWTDVVRKSPNLSRAHVNLGKALIKEGNYATARETLVRAINLDPENGTGYMNLAFVLEQQNLPGEALRYTEKALKAGNADPARIHQIRGLAFAKLNDFQSAIKEMEKALSYNPESAEIYVNSGVIYGRNGNSQKAAEHFRKAFELDPYNDSVLQNLAFELGKQNRTTEAIQILEQALQKSIGNAAAIHSILAELFLRQKKTELALSHANQSIQINPEVADGYVVAGLVYETMNQDKLAFVQYEKAWQRGVNMVSLYNQWAERALQKGNGDKAMKYLNEALKLSPADKQTRQNIFSVKQYLRQM